MRERLLVRRQQVRQAFVQEPLRETAAAIPQRHDEHVVLGRHAAQQHRPLAPVHLRLLAQGRLVAALREPVQAGRRAQRPHRQLDGLVAADPGALSAQLLVQDARRPMHLRRTLLQPGAMRIQQPRRRQLPPVRSPRGLSQVLPHRLAIQVQIPRDPRHALAPPMPFMDRFPLLSADQVFPRVPWLRPHGRTCRADSCFHLVVHVHLSLLRVDGWGKFDYRRWGLLDYR